MIELYSFGFGFVAGCVFSGAVFTYIIKREDCRSKDAPRIAKEIPPKSD